MIKELFLNPSFTLGIIIKAPFKWLLGIGIYIFRVSYFTWYPLRRSMGKTLLDKIEPKVKRANK